jgi:hypothetical protein
VVDSDGMTTNEEGTTARGAIPRKCAIEECRDFAFIGSFCQSHYKRWSRGESLARAEHCRRLDERRRLLGYLSQFFGYYR